MPENEEARGTAPDVRSVRSDRYRDRPSRRRRNPYERGSLGRLVAEVAAETGIPPRELVEDGVMLLTLVDVLQERAKRR